MDALPDRAQALPFHTHGVPWTIPGVLSGHDSSACSFSLFLPFPASVETLPEGAKAGVCDICAVMGKVSKTAASEYTCVKKRN
jgi:hypothetical protein